MKTTKSDKLNLTKTYSLAFYFEQEMRKTMFDGDKPKEKIDRGDLHAVKLLARELNSAINAVAGTFDGQPPKE